MKKNLRSLTNETEQELRSGQEKVDYSGGESRKEKKTSFQKREFPEELTSPLKARNATGKGGDPAIKTFVSCLWVTKGNGFYLILRTQNLEEKEESNSPRDF